MNIKSSIKPIDIKPPFDFESAKAKVQAAEDAWNSRDPKRVAKAYSVDSEWRNRTEFLKGRDAIEEFLSGKWEKEKYYKLMKELWAYTDNHISVRFEYEWFNESEKQWYRTHGNEHWEFAPDGLMQKRDMSANDVPINENELRYAIPGA